jgi:hypothetical protein
MDGPAHIDRAHAGGKEVKMDGKRFDALARQLAAPRSRRSVLGLLAGLATGAAGRNAVGAAPKDDKPSKCYGEGSSCTNAKQCCSDICTNRRCAAPVPQCTVASECPGTDTDCRFRTCNGGACGFDNVAGGTLTSQQTAGDCRKNVCDGAGGVSSVVDDTDVPNDSNDCTTDTCQNGVPSSLPMAVGSPCAGGAKFCNSAGQCVDCLVAGDCPGQDTECQHRTCTAGHCGLSNAAQGTALSQQTPGDCRTAVCDGNGGVTTIFDNTDVPADDGNPCTTAACSSGVPMQTNVPAGQPCGGGRVCNGNGGCGVCVPGSTQSCYSGPPSTAGVGICRSGTQACLPDGSGFGPCFGEITPQVETCNGLDENCNGEPDDGAFCPPVPNGFLICSGGQCVVAGCNPGFMNCNGISVDGCETQVSSNRLNCGTCGHVCPAPSICRAGQCCIASGPPPEGMDCCDVFNADLEVCVFR